MKIGRNIAWIIVVVCIFGLIACDHVYNDVFIIAICITSVIAMILTVLSDDVEDLRGSKIVRNILWILNGVSLLLCAVTYGNTFGFTAFTFLAALIMTLLIRSIQNAENRSQLIQEQERIEKQLREQEEIKQLERRIYDALDIHWSYTNGCDASVRVDSLRAFDTYDINKFFKDRSYQLQNIQQILKERDADLDKINGFLTNNEFMNEKHYHVVESKLRNILPKLVDYRVNIYYTSPAGRSSRSKTLVITQDSIDYWMKNRSETAVRTDNKTMLNSKQQEYIKRISDLINTIDDIRNDLVVNDDIVTLDAAYDALMGKTVSGVKRIKDVDSAEWSILESYLARVSDDISEINRRNGEIRKYYVSDEFKAVKSACRKLMESQREFNEYIEAKIKSISTLFGKRVVRNETSFEDTYEYTHSYKKDITPFTANVSSSVFSSAENIPLEYVVKQFYPDKSKYVEQIQNLQFLVSELETLDDARKIIEHNKEQVHQYLTNVPSIVMKYDEDGFYSRLGFAIVNEKSLTVAYKFVYTSEAGMAQRSFTVPMTEETIVQLIDILSSKLTYDAFKKEQRSLMTTKLRKQIKERDNYTCQYCGNSVHKEPNLLLEIDHIIPVAKGGCTIESNLQTLCWRCNRKKSDKVSDETIQYSVPTSKVVEMKKVEPKIVEPKRSMLPSNNESVNRIEHFTKVPRNDTLAKLGKQTNKVCKNCNSANLILIERTAEFNRYQCPKCGKRYKKTINTNK